MKKLLTLVALVFAGFLFMYLLNDRKEKEAEAKCRAEFNKMLQEDEVTKAIINMADSPLRSLEWKSQNNLKKFQDYVNTETTNCVARQAALNDFKNKITEEVLKDAHKMAEEIKAGQMSAN